MSAVPSGSSIPARRVLLSAFGIHIGGGLVLLQSLLRAAAPRLKASALDARLPLAVRPGGDVHIDYVERSFPARLASLHRLARNAGEGDVLFCFNGLPPLRRVAGARVICYVHAPHLAGLHRGIRYGALTAMRIWIERSWLRLGVGHCDELWVQTATMAEALRVEHPGAVVRVLPFVDDDLFAALGAATPAAPGVNAALSPASFFYPAEAVGHKNHVQLLRAWVLLAERGCRPLLHLTLRPQELQALTRQVPAGAALPHVVNLGRLERDGVMQTLRDSSALLFPSSAETFGLPMLEARALGVPVLAAERDFVRDVCDPVQTFDPASPRSIADAVQRFLQPGPRAKSPVLDAAGLVAQLVA